MISEKVIEHFRVASGKHFRLRDHDPAWSQSKELKRLTKSQIKSQAVEFLNDNLRELNELQTRLYAEDRYSLLVILQAMDAAGKDGTIKHVMSGLNPQGCQVFSFKRPTHEELDHNFLWRCSRALPERGRIGIFNRSYYEEVLVVKVHPELLDQQRLPPGKRGDAFWKGRYEDINAFEKHLARNGTKVLKFFLNVSKREQKRRLLERLDQPAKHWKFDANDVKERERWKDYQVAYEEMIRATSSSDAPWYVVPADNKWVTRAVVSHVLADTMKKMHLAYPQVTKEQLAAITKAKRQLASE